MVTCTETLRVQAFQEHIKTDVMNFLLVSAASSAGTQGSCLCEFF